MSRYSKKNATPATLANEQAAFNKRRLKRTHHKDELAQFPMHTDVRIISNGTKLSERDTIRVSYSYCLWLLTIKDCYHVCEARKLISDCDRLFSKARVTSLLRGLMASDLANVISNSKAMLLALRGIPYDGVNRNDFQEYMNSYGVSRTDVLWKAVGHLVKSAIITADPVLFAEANTCVQFIHRLTLTDVEGLEAKMIEDYINFEKHLKTQQYDWNLMNELRSIITEWFSHVDFSHISGDHGYGATSVVKRGAGTDAKYHAMIPTKGTARVRQLLGWDPANELAWPGLKAKYDSYLYISNTPSRDILLDTSKIMLVPKGIDKKRVISMETVNNQFFQKMLFHVMDNHFEKHPEIGVHLHNQEINRDLALKGSYHYDYATIDLSSASDSVTWTIVEYLFRDTPLYYPMVWTRTNKVQLPDGCVMEIEKAYPMGSALCFPVECTVFSVCRELARRRTGSHRVGGVYGDDCVIPKEYEEEFLSILESLHFIVNRDKSYLSEHAFKEACGAECLNGFNVEPLRLPRSFDILELPRRWETTYSIGLKHRRRISTCRHDRGTQLMCMYKLSQEAYDKGYTSLYQAIMRITLGYHPNAICTEIGTNGLRVRSIDPWLEWLPADKVRYNTSLQRIEVLCEVITSEVKRGEQAYSKCLEEMYYTRRKALNEETLIEARTGEAVTSVRNRWIPVDDIAK